MERYDHQKIEKKWQEKWKEEELYETKDSVRGKENYYTLVEFAYPSGNLHVGHWYAFSVPDMYARYMRMNGYNVMYPFGFDSFGLPAENAAIKRGRNPRDWTYSNIAYMRDQLDTMGTMFDWSREVVTSDPKYYKWTQWLFLEFLKNNLAYRAETKVNWCSSCKTVLANEQVVSGSCERCGTDIEQKQMEQWMFKIRDYADRLLEDLEELNWPEPIKEAQRAWIGRSEGAELDFEIEQDISGNDFLLLHAHKGSSRNEYIPWLKKELESRGAQSVTTLDLPGGANPDMETQLAFLEDTYTFTERTVVVTHSLSGPLMLKMLPRLKKKIYKVVFVAPPLKPVFIDKERPELEQYTDWEFDFDAASKNVQRVVVVADTYDPVVPKAQTETIARSLGGRYTLREAEEAHFDGAVEPEVLHAVLSSIKVFTTRPDTLYGATYMVIAPEHELVNELQEKIENWDEVEKYVKQAGKKTELERQENKEKTGVELKGVKAVNPGTQEEIPIWVADYVLSTVGTGAIMAVPAHDERDFAFANTYQLPIRQVVATRSENHAGYEVVDTKETVERNNVYVFVQHPEKEEFLFLEWKAEKEWGTSPIIGGVNKGETYEDAARREIREETGYTDIGDVSDVGFEVHSLYFHPVKDVNRHGKARVFYTELKSLKQETVAPEERAQHESVWIPKEHVLKKLPYENLKIAWEYFVEPYALTGEGVLINSGDFDGLSTEEAREKITESVGGTKKTQYRIRDWGVSRQRYWGCPIPVVYCDTCGVVGVPETELPVELPEVEDYVPSGDGKSPLAKVSDFVNTTCPECSRPAKRETDTLDTFVDSSWYFLRYTDPHNEEKFADKKKMNKWMPINFYSGGAEHTTMHLLYSRFFQKVLYDLGHVADKEPYTRRMNRGIILGPDGNKMSKSKGNVIDPDDVVKRYGTDTVRTYLAFIGPYNEVGHYPWSTESIVGVRRFLDRVWKLARNLQRKSSDETVLEVHKTIQRVTLDIQQLKMNTCIAAFMSFMNVAERSDIAQEEFETFLTILAPFAPHLTEELWREMLGHTTSIHLEEWPQYDPGMLQEEAVTIVIQINGKKRSTITVSSDVEKEEVLKEAKKAVEKWLTNATIQKEVYISGKLVNLVLD